MLAVDGDEALVADASGEDVDLLADLVHREDAAALHGVALAEAAVLAAVHAGVRNVEWREHDDAVVVYLVLDAVRRRPHLLEERGIRHLHERGSLLREERLARGLALRDDLADARGIGGLRLGVGERAADVGVVDEMLAAGEILVDLFLDDEMFPVVLFVLELPDAVQCSHL